MIDRRLEEHCRRRIGVCGWEIKGELEGEAAVGGVRRAGDGGGPIEEIFARGEGGDGRGGREH